MRKLRRFWPVLVLALAAGLLLWWVRDSRRPEYVLHLGKEALQRNDLDTAERQALRLEAVGALDAARLLRSQILLTQAKSLDASDPQARSLCVQALALLNQIEDQAEIRHQAI